jgi:hypothetical protein
VLLRLDRQLPRVLPSFHYSSSSSADRKHQQEERDAIVASSALAAGFPIATTKFLNLHHLIYAHSGTADRKVVETVKLLPVPVGDRAYAPTVGEATRHPDESCRCLRLQVAAGSISLIT